MARRFINIIPIIIVILVVAVTGWLWHTTTSCPELVVSDIDLGTYKSARTLERAIRLDNRGSGELLVHDVKTCCGISLLGDFAKRIPAGSTEVIVLQIKPRGGPVPYENSFTLHTNDSRKPVKKVFVRGTPNLPIYVSPSSIDLKHIVAGEQVANAVTFLIPDNKQPAFSLVTSSPNIQISSPRSIPARRFGNREYNMFVMDVAVDKETPRGAMQEYILVKTGIARRPYVVVPVKGMVERGLRVRPEQIFFGMVRGESIVTRSIRLEVIGPGWNAIKVAPTNCPGIAAKLQQKGEKKFELHVSLDPARMPEQLKSYITLEDSSGDTLQIPVLAVRKTL